MKTVDREYVESHKEEIIEAIQKGSIFIYPTDTIYGLGCNALLDDAVMRLRELKHREEKPFSVIAPSKNWIIKNCEVKSEDLDKYLPGPYTLFVRRDENAVSRFVNQNDDTLGVRIPTHWFTEIIAEAGVPFVTTSVNLSGEKHMEDMNSASKEILDQVDYVIYEGEKRGEPSKKINLVS
ncbi:MAG: L-threonylcarbamoyladenylate synthase [Parcubacteria group bacterium]